MKTTSLLIACTGIVLVDPMNPRFVEATGDFVYSTVREPADPANDRERALVRMIRGFPALVADGDRQRREVVALVGLFDGVLAVDHHEQVRTAVGGVRGDAHVGQEHLGEVRVPGDLA